MVLVAVQIIVPSSYLTQYPVDADPPDSAIPAVAKSTPASAANTLAPLPLSRPTISVAVSVVTSFGPDGPCGPVLPGRPGHPVRLVGLEARSPQSLQYPPFGLGTDHAALSPQLLSPFPSPHSYVAIKWPRSSFENVGTGPGSPFVPFVSLRAPAPRPFRPVPPGRYLLSVPAHLESPAGRYLRISFLVPAGL